MNAAALNNGMQRGLIVMVVFQFAIGFIVALNVLMVLASILSLWGGVGRAELALLSMPAILVGVWTSRRVGSRFRSV